jgi:hypothetical protein
LTETTTFANGAGHTFERIVKNTSRLRGWGPRRQGAKRPRPAALRNDRISAPWVVDGSINGELFTLCGEKILAPTLLATGSHLSARIDLIHTSTPIVFHAKLTGFGAFRRQSAASNHFRVSDLQPR